METDETMSYKSGGRKKSTCRNSNNKNEDIRSNVYHWCSYVMSALQFISTRNTHGIFTVLLFEFSGEFQVIVIYD